jgi:hypothetical protein
VELALCERLVWLQNRGLRQIEIQSSSGTTITLRFRFNGNGKNSHPSAAEIVE